ncbi:MAG: hypothetical protein ABR596_08565 [Halarsenatibacteraceae bacterium]
MSGIPKQDQKNMGHPEAEFRKMPVSQMMEQLEKDISDSFTLGNSFCVFAISLFFIFV